MSVTSSTVHYTCNSCSVTYWENVLKYMHSVISYNTKTCLVSWQCKPGLWCLITLHPSSHIWHRLASRSILGHALLSALIIRYRRSYDSEYTAPLVNHHIWPALMQGVRVVVKGEANTRRGASLVSCHKLIQVHSVCVLIWFDGLYGI